MSPSRLLAAFLLFLTVAAPLPAQTSPGAIDGVALNAEDGAPLPFALVRLLPAAGEGAPLQQGVTGPQGRFHFAGIAAGEYRLQLARIGYRPVTSAVVRVAAGQTLRHDLRGAAEPIPLAAVTVRSAGSCVALGQLGEEPQLAALWNEARKGVETRRAFELQYRFTRVFRQDVRTSWRLRRDTRSVRADTMRSEPDSVLVQDQRRQERHRREGYASGSLVVLPDEKELLDDAFLRDHCLETTTAEGDGVLGLRFRPIAARRGAVGIRGTIWVDASTYLIRRLGFEWLDGERAFASSEVDYADVPVAGSALRLPTAGRATVDMRGPASALVSGASATITFAYGDFAAARPR